MNHSDQDQAFNGQAVTPKKYVAPDHELALAGEARRVDGTDEVAVDIAHGEVSEHKATVFLSVSKSDGPNGEPNSIVDRQYTVVLAGEDTIFDETHPQWDEVKKDYVEDTDADDALASVLEDSDALECPDNDIY